MKKETPTKIICIGLGSAGSNIVEDMYKDQVNNMDFLIANTDKSSLSTYTVTTKIQLGNEVLENYDKIHNLLEGADIVFIIAGLGGVTGTGVAPIIAKIAKEVNALTIGIVTKPFKLEGIGRVKLANQGVLDLQKECDTVIVIPNDKILSMIDKHTSLQENFKIIGSFVAQAVTTIASMVQSQNDNDIYLDICDLKTVLNHPGNPLIGIAEYQGENSAYNAMKIAIDSPIYEVNSLNGALGVLANFHMHPKFPLMEIAEAMEIIHDSVDEDADVIFGTTTDITMPIDVIRITLIATGLEKDTLIHVNNIY